MESLHSKWFISKPTQFRKLDKDEFHGSFFHAVNFVRKQKFDHAASFIKKARITLHKNLSKNIQQSYSRSYTDIYHAQLLSELEEVIYLKQVRGLSRESVRRVQIQSMWESRLVGSNVNGEMVKMEGVRPDIEDWQTILLVRGLDQVINRRTRADMDADDISVRKTELIFCAT